LYYQGRECFRETAVKSCSAGKKLAGPGQGAIKILESGRIPPSSLKWKVREASLKYLSKNNNDGMGRYMVVQKSKVKQSLRYQHLSVRRHNERFLPDRQGRERGGAVRSRDVLKWKRRTKSVRILHESLTRGPEVARWGEITPFNATITRAAATVLYQLP